MIRSEYLGSYRDNSTGHVFDVIKHVRLVAHRPVDGEFKWVDGSVSYRTWCGLDLKAASEDLAAFVSVDGATLVKTL